HRAHEAPGEGGDDRERREQRHDREAGVDRRATLDLLQEQGEDEKRAEGAEVHRRRGGVGDREAPRRRKRPSGSIAAAPRRRSTTRKSAARRSAQTTAAITVGEPAPSRPASMNANVIAASRAAPDATPRTSRVRPRRSALSCTIAVAATNETATIGTLT